MAFRREDWNEIIQQVNEVLQNPPSDTDCEPLPPIEEVGPNHIWSKGDIQEVQDALKATCEDISFGPIPDLWKQSILDEINDAIGQAWCDCEDECDDDASRDEDGTEFVLLDAGPPRVVSPCLGDNEVLVFLRDFIDGLEIGKPKVCNRVWRAIFRQVSGTGSVIESQLSVGVIDCDGKIIATNNVRRISTLNGTQLTPHGVFVGCGVCGSDFCNQTIDETNAYIQSHPDEFYHNSIIIQIDAAGAFCCDCDPPAPGPE